MVSAGLIGHNEERFQMGWAERECSPATEFLPGLPGSRSGNGSRCPHGLLSADHSLPEQHKWVASAKRGSRVGHCPTDPGRACCQCRGPAPHPIKRVVPERAPQSGGQPYQTPIIRRLPLRATVKCSNITHTEACRPGSPSSLSPHHLAGIPRHQS